MIGSWPNHLARILVFGAAVLSLVFVGGGAATILFGNLLGYDPALPTDPGASTDDPVNDSVHDPLAEAINRLDQPSRASRIRAAWWLRSNGRAAALPLLRALAHGGRSARFTIEAARCLNEITPVPVAALTAALEDSSPTLRRWALIAIAMRARRDPAELTGLRPAVLRLFERSDADDRALIELVLRAWPEPGSTPARFDPSRNPLLALMRRHVDGGSVPDPAPAAPPERVVFQDLGLATTLALLGIHHGSEARAGLLLSLRDAHAIVRRHAATALGALRPRDIAIGKTLVSGLEDPDPKVRAAVAAALAEHEIMPSAAGSALLQSLTDPHESTRLAAVAALHAYGFDRLPLDARPKLLDAVRRISDLPERLAELDVAPMREAAASRLRRACEALYRIRVLIPERRNSRDWRLRGLSYEPVPRSYRQRHLVMLFRTLARYPASMIRCNLESVVFTARLVGSDGVGYGGTYRHGAVLLANRFDHGRWLAEAFHHEFSSILMHRYGFPRDGWRGCNPPGFHYGPGGHEALKTGKTAPGSPKYYRQGFVDQYGQSDLENDFNTFTGLVLGRPDEARRLIRTYPRLRAKWRVWIRFYHRIDDYFTEETVLGRREP